MGITTGQEIRRFDGAPENGIWQGAKTAARFSPDGQMILTSRENQLILWDTATGREIRRVTLPSDQINDFSTAFSPDGRRLAVGTRNGDILLFDTEAGLEIRRFIGQQDISHIEFNSDGQLLLSTAWNNTDPGIRLWDTSGEEVSRFSGISAVSPDGQMLVLRDRSWDNASAMLRLMETASHREVGRLDIPAQSFVITAAFSPDRRYLAVSIHDAERNRGQVLVWDLTSHQILSRFAQIWGGVNLIAFTPDGTHVLTVQIPFGNSLLPQQTITLWDITTGFPIWDSVGDQRWTSLVVSPDGRRAVMGGEDSFDLWDIDTGQLIRRFSVPSWTPLFSSDGNRIVSGVGKDLILWDSETGEEIRRYVNHPAADDFVFALSPDNILMASGDLDGTILL